jgi:hypothetical protein
VRSTATSFGRPIARQQLPIAVSREREEQNLYFRAKTVYDNAQSTETKISVMLIFGPDPIIVSLLLSLPIGGGTIILLLSVILVTVVVLLLLSVSTGGGEGVEGVSTDVSPELMVSPAPTIRNWLRIRLFYRITRRIPCLEKLVTKYQSRPIKLQDIVV